MERAEERGGVNIREERTRKKMGQILTAKSAKSAKEDKKRRKKNKKRKREGKKQ
jgi:hypothetical protein